MSTCSKDNDSFVLYDISDVKVEKVDVKSTGAKGKGRKIDPTTEVHSDILCITKFRVHLEVLSLSVDRQLEDLDAESIPELLPNVKTLKLTLPTEEYDSLIAFIEIAKKCDRSWKLFKVPRSL